MRKVLVILAALLALQTQAQTHDWENPAVLGINKLPYHATLQLPSKQKDCKEIVSLDGQWLFHWSRNPEERPIDFYKEDYDVSHWDKITVPGNWQLQGYGTPIYVNMSYPFAKDRPSVTSEPPKDWTAYENRNPVGSYVTFVDVTKDMLSKNLILHFGGVHSAMYLWVNGQKVGYSQNSMSPAEFDVTCSTVGKTTGTYCRLSSDGCSQCRLLAVHSQCKDCCLQYRQENGKESVGSTADGLSRVVWCQRQS